MVIVYLYSIFEVVRIFSFRYYVLLVVNMGKVGGFICDMILVFYYIRMYYVLVCIFVECVVFLVSGGFCE